MRGFLDELKAAVYGLARAPAFTSLAVGVPCSRPVVVLNVAHAGLLVIENVNESPSGSLAVGWNE